MNLETIIKNLTYKVKELEPNAEISIYNLLGKDVISNYSSKDLFDIDNGVIKNIKKKILI